MQIAFRILANTPVWVFALLAYLIWQGWQARQPRTQAIWRMLIVPLVFFLMGLSRLVLARDHGLEPLMAWLVAAILFGALALWQCGSAAPQRHGLLAAIWRRGRHRYETGTARRRGDRRPRRLRRQRGLLFGVGGGTIAPIPEFRPRPKYRDRKSSLAH
jgi:hypothetical protein